jgi:chemotaxis protein methyltransferase CheR
MEERALQALEIDLLLEAIQRRYGYDFRSYARASIERRIRQFMSNSGRETAGEMIPELLRSPGFASELVQYLSVTVTEMFRDPHVYRSLRANVAPLLRSFPFLKVWHAGCATGEEVYSMAIVLEEEGLLDRTTIFGTDINDASLARARDGIYPLESIREFTRNYQQAGGTGSFSDYYHARYAAAVMERSLKRRITFANHNLATDAVFSETHLILCRNVLIYFKRELQDRALHVFTDSLVRGGYLCLGTKEDIQFSSVRDNFDVLDQRAKIFKKRHA